MDDPRRPEAPGCDVFAHELVVRPTDVDSAGHVNHVSMVALFEYGRMRAHHDVRMARPELPDMKTVVRRVAVDYLAQARVFDVLTVRSWIRRDGTTSRTWAQELVRPDGTVVARAEVTSVLLDRASGRPVALPALYRDLFAPHRETPSSLGPGPR